MFLTVRLIETIAALYVMYAIGVNNNGKKWGQKGGVVGLSLLATCLLNMDLFRYGKKEYDAMVQKQKSSAQNKKTSHYNA
jgi:hypothetical protein